MTMDCVWTPSPVKRMPCSRIAVGDAAGGEDQLAARSQVARARTPCSGRGCPLLHAFLLRLVLHHQAAQNLAVEAGQRGAR